MRAAAKKNLAPLAESVSRNGKEPSTGGSKQPNPFAILSKNHLTSDEATFFLRNLATLCGNGVSLPKAIAAIAGERQLAHRSGLLNTLRRKVESGDLFSSSLPICGPEFDGVVLGQVRVGERAGTLAETLSKIADQREQSSKIKETVLKKLAYPITLCVVGTGVVGFLLGYVVPVFEETYRDAGVPLPWITRVMIGVGGFAQSYWWAVLGLIAVSALVISRLRKNDEAALWMDSKLLRIPLLGPWLRDIALLQLMEVIGCLMEAGFNLADALDEAADSVANRQMKQAVTDLRSAVQRGERFSREVEAHSDLFPPMVSQLIIVGEQTGKLTSATQHIREHLREEINRKGDLAVGVLEPSLTITLAAAVAAILMAIYLPMFDMIRTV